MTFLEVRKYYGTYANFERKTVWKMNSLFRWKRLGYIPNVAQKKLEELTNGELKAYWNKEENK